jgi:hypothetical protein
MMARIFQAPVGTAQPTLDNLLDADGKVMHPWTEVAQVNAMPPGDPEAKVDSKYKRLVAGGLNHYEALAQMRMDRVLTHTTPAPRVSVRSFEV